MDFLRWLRLALGGVSLERQPVAPVPKTIDESPSAASFREAVSWHTRGDLDRAEAIYRTILDDDPDFVPALHLLGRIQGQRGKVGDAKACLERALTLSSDDGDILADLAAVRRIEERPGDARRLLEKAIDLEPERAAFHHALASLDLESGNIKDAIAALERTVALAGDHADAHSDLGAAYLELGKYDEAQRSLETAVRLSPSSSLPHRNLANLYLKLGDADRAARSLRDAFAHASDDVALRKRLAEVLLQSGSAAAALEEYQFLARSQPDEAWVWKRLAETASALDRKADAISWYRRALEIDPRQPEVLNNLGILLSESGRYEEAVEAFEEAVRLQPDFDRGFDNLGGTLHLQGRYEEAFNAFTKSLDIDPLNTVTLSNLIAITNYRSELESGFVHTLHTRYLRAVAPERSRALKRRGNDPGSERRLRVGYVSADFRRHSVAFFIEALIEGHDRRRFEVYCYADVARPDPVTERLRTLADHWRDVCTTSDEALAERIRGDRIDLLVDLGGHFAGNRLPVFAQRPAPVQMAYLGYPATTGLPEIHYRLTDAVADPIGEADPVYREKLIRLPSTFLCYRPPDTAPPVAGASRAQNVLIIFGSFNELPKISPEVIRSWCRILERVPESRLLLKATALSEPATRARLERRFEAAGVSTDRLELKGRTATLEDHLALYARVDVALDTFPYNGTTTTCEALYMGVPVVTLAKGAHAGRVGASLLSVLELSELVAVSEEDYEGKAVDLAADDARRRTYRSTLRDRMRASPLCDARRFAQSVETSFLKSWDAWLKSEKRPLEREPLPLRVGGALEIEGRDGLRMVLPDDLDQLTTYVLLEQEDWFEDEAEFLRRFLSPGMRVLDVGANFGVYTLLAARCVGEKGRVFSVEPSARTARWLRANVALNELNMVEILQLALSDQEGDLKLSVRSGAECHRLVGDTTQFERTELVKALRLDDCARHHAMDAVDFVKLDAEGAEKQIIDGGYRFFAEESPLVMFEIRSEEAFDLDLVGKFSSLGYDPFRLIPGLELLAPLDPSEPLDAFALNLFAMKDDRQKVLIDREFLATGVAQDSIAGGAGRDAVWNYFLSKPYSRSRVKGWKSRIGSKNAAAERRWMEMLGHCVAAADVASPPPVRLASLKAAFGIAAADMPGIEPAARLNSLARIAWALGYRSRALGALRELMNLDTDAARSFDWPFLPAAPHFDAVDPGDRLAAWCRACVRDQFECLRSFSSYFLDERASKSLEQLKRSEFQRPEMERRRLLMRLRYGRPLGEVSTEVRVKSPANSNPAFWSSRLEK